MYSHIKEAVTRRYGFGTAAGQPSVVVIAVNPRLRWFKDKKVIVVHAEAFRKNG